MSDQDQLETQDNDTRADTPTDTPTGAADGTPGQAPSDLGETTAPVKKATRPRKKAVAKKAAVPDPGADPRADTDMPSAGAGEGAPADGPAGETTAPVKKTTRPRKKAAAKKTTAAVPPEAPELPLDAPTADTPVDTAADTAATSGAPMVVFQAPEKPVTRTTTRSRTRKTAAAPTTPAAEVAEGSAEAAAAGDAGQPDAVAPRAKKAASKSAKAKKSAAAEQLPDEADAAGEGTTPTTEVAEVEPAPARASRKKGAKSSKKAAASPDADAADEAAPAAASEEAAPAAEAAAGSASPAEAADAAGAEEASDEEQQGEGGGRRRSRRRGGRRRRKGSGGSADDAERDTAEATSEEDAAEEDSEDQGGGEGTSKRRRTRTRTPKNPEDEIASVSGSTRLEAKKQRRREGREAGRRRAPIVSEAEFLARRESVERVMVIRQRGDLTQIAVLEDNVLVEHYVSRESQTSLIGNVYLGRVQNVLPSMEAAFIDIGKGRNAVLYAGEVNWSGLGHKEGEPRKIESVLQSGQTILVQVTKDPIGHKGARLTGQVSLPGRFLVYVPDGTTSGISRKLPDTERNRLKTLLKQIVPESAGVIVRTAAEGASEEELTQDVERLTARWHDIEAKVKAGRSPELLYGEPDLTLKVVRDLFTEDFARLVVEGDEAWDLVDGYVAHVAPDLRERLERYRPDDDADGTGDAFSSYRIDEQIAKALDRKVWLPSGGSLVIDRTEAMTVVDVNTGKFTGSGGNLEETVTKNNLEAAEEIVRQLRLRDIGGIVVVDFIDMVLESNRDLVLRRLVECLGRDRTRHQVAEVTSLGLVQMTRKRIGTGLLEAFSQECAHCRGRGVVVHDHPIETAGSSATDEEPRRRRSGGRGARGRNGAEPQPEPVKPSPKDLAVSRPSPSRPVEDEEPEAQQDQDERQDQDAPATAGPDHGANASAPEVEPSSVESSDSAQVDDSAEEAPVSTASEGAVEIPAAPVVVTTRRRRTATRPAGPPAGGADATVADGSAAAAPEARADEGAPNGIEALDEAGQPIPHVPVKKKGSRKR